MIDVDAAKAWIKPDDDSEDAVIGALVNAAVKTIEMQTDKFLSVKDFTQELSGFPGCHPYEIRLLKGPVGTITGIEYDPSDGSAATPLASYRLVEGVNARLLPAYGEVWPATLDGSGTVRITGTAGYADDEVPDLDQACLMLVAHWYQNREAVLAGPTASAIELPLAIEMLIRPYRPSGLA
jgi:uncharacterized phiE125 gp8 family phage protein